VPSKTQQLKDLADLLDRGLLTREEFETEKKRILGGPPSTHSLPAVPDPASAAVGDRVMPTTVGSYHVEEELSVDALGAWYLGRHTIESVAERQGGDIWLRVLHPDLSTDEDYIERVREEADPGLKLTHTNLADVQSSTIEIGLVIVAIRPLPGRRLSELLADTPGQLPNAMDVAGGIMEAVGYAHSRGVVHGGLSPDTVFVSDAGTVVVDAGIARPPGKVLAARPGAGAAAVAYVAPELHTGTDADDRADVWSIGLLLYRMLSGSLPWPAGTSVEGVQAAKEAGLEPSDALGPLAGVISQALAPEPDHRPNTVKKLAAALLAAAKAATDKAAPGPAPAAAPAPEPAPTPPPADPEPEPAPADTTAQAEPAPTPEPEPAKPEPEPAKPQPEPAKPQPEPAKPEPEPAKPQPEPAKPQPEPAKTPAKDDDDDEPKKPKKKGGSCLIQGCGGCAGLVVLFLGVLVAGITMGWFDDLLCEIKGQTDLEFIPCVDQTAVATPAGKAAPSPDGSAGDATFAETGDATAEVDPEVTPDPDDTPEITPSPEVTPAPTPTPREESTPPEARTERPTRKPTPEPTPREQRTPEPTPREQRTPEPVAEATTPRPEPSLGSEGPSDFIIGTIVGNNAVIKRCISTEKDRGTDIPNPLSVRFTISSSGSVSRARVSSSGWTGTGLDSCISRELNKLSFPPWEGDRKKVSYGLSTH
jgi:serine/threonine-protein kinase